MKMSARNCIEGKIINIKEGHGACEVTIASPAGAKAYVVNKDQPTSAAGALRPNARP